MAEHLQTTTIRTIHTPGSHGPEGRLYAKLPTVVPGFLRDVCEPVSTLDGGALVLMAVAAAAFLRWPKAAAAGGAVFLVGTMTGAWLTGEWTAVWALDEAIAFHFSPTDCQQRLGLVGLVAGLAAAKMTTVVLFPKPPPKVDVKVQVT